MRRGARLAAALAALLTAAGCTFLYLPPVPDDLPPIPDRTRIAQTHVADVDGRPAVTFTPREVPEPGWLQVQWYGPAGGAVASASVWLDPDAVDRPVRVPFPDDVARDRGGRWRAVLSFDGEVLRQVAWEEPGSGG